MPDINRALLDAHCSTRPECIKDQAAFAACQALEGLARWWLPAEVLRSAHRKNSDYPHVTSPDRPQLPSDPGSCWVVFRNKKPKDRPQKHPLLGSGVLLPLRWKEGRHSDRLPKGLCALADGVVASLATSIPRFRRQWSLHLADLPPLANVRLRDDLPLTYGSGWASLAGGLITLVEGLQPNANIWATGRWEEGAGVARIGGLAEKLALANEWRARGPAEWDRLHFFVPESQVAAAKAWANDNAPDQIVIGALRRTAEADPMAALNPYLATLAAVPPDPVEGSPDEEKQLEVCRNYYIHQDPQSWRDYYRDHLLAAIVRRCRREYDKLTLSRPFSHFVTIVSHRHELAMINPLVVRAKRCLLLYHDLKDEATACRSWLEATPRSVKCDLVSFSLGTQMPFDISQAVGRFVQGVAPEQVALDLTPGTKLMSYSLSQAAKVGNWLYFLGVKYRYEHCPDGRPLPATETPELLPVR